MMAIFTGAGTGFERGSGNVLGGAGLLGSGSAGRAGEQVMLNAATGNLMITRQDEYLVGRGPDASVSRTYNSQGDLTDDNNDNWRQSTQRQVRDLTGNLNSWGSTVKRVSGDSSIITYAWDGAAYVATDGAGAHDRITFDGGAWRWTDGDTGTVEVYGGPANWISQVIDTDGHTVSFAYANNQLIDVTTSNGEKIHYTWSGANLKQVATIYNDGGTWRQSTRTRYDHDVYGRLSSVTVDLTPDDNSISDGNTHVTVYHYEGATHLVRAITQTGDFRLDFGYDTNNRVISLKQFGVAQGTRTTTIAYGAGFTTVTDPQGQTTRLDHDPDGRLLGVTVPASQQGGQARTTRFEYGAAGTVANLFDGGGTRIAGNVVTKAGASSWGNHVAYGDLMSGTASVEFRFDNPNPSGAYQQAGLATESNRAAVGSYYGDGGFAAGIYFDDASANLMILDGGNATRIALTGTSSDLWRITYDGSSFKYFKNGNLFHTQAAAVGLNLAFKSRAYSQGATVRDIAYAGGTIAKLFDGGGSQITGNILTKTSATAWGNHVAYGDLMFGTASVEFRFDNPNPSGAYQQAGLATESNRAAVGSYYGDGSFAAGIYFDDASAHLMILDGGNATRIALTGNSSDLWRITYDGSSFKYYKNGNLFHTQAAAVGLNLAFKSRAYSQGATIRDIAYTGGTDLPSRSARTPSAVIDANGSRTRFFYDAAGNNIGREDPLGNVTTRIYGPANRVLAETTTGSDANGAAVAHTVRYAYDAGGRLRFAVDAEGGVTEYTYNGAYEVNGIARFAGVRYDTTGWSPAKTLEFAAISAWRGQVDRSSVHVTTIERGARGEVLQETMYSASGVDGMPLEHEGYGGQRSTYDQSGRLLSRYTSNQNTEYFVYDGLGRVVASTDTAGATTRIAFQDSSNRTVVTLASGLVTTSTYNPAGELIATAEGGTHLSGGTATYSYDSLGRLRGAVDATGIGTWHIYDTVGRKVAEATRDGWLTEYRYDDADRLVATVRYANAMAGWQWAAASDPNQSPQVAQLRPAASAQDIWDWTVYDADGRVIETIGGDGAATTFEYDGSDRLVRTTAHATKLEAWRVDGFKGNPPATLQAPTASTADSVERRFYDRVGRLIGTLDGEGRLSRFGLNAIGEKLEEVHFANLVPEHLRAQGSFTQLVASVGTSAADAATRWVYDNQGHVRFEIDALNRVTEYGYQVGSLTYTAFGPVRQVTRYAGSIVPLGSYTLATVRQAIANAGLAGHAGNRTSQSVHDAAGRLVYTIDAEGAVTGFSYDAMGNVVRTIAYADRRMPTPAAVPDAATMNGWHASAIGNAANRITRAYYNGRNEQRFTVDAEGYVTRNDYDAEGRLTYAVTWSTALPVTDGWTIDTVAAYVSGETAGTTYAYNVNGRLSRTVDATGTATDYHYAANGTLIWEIVAPHTGDEARVHHVYDASGREVIRYDAMSTADQSATRYAYDGRGNLVSTTDGAGRVTTRSYDRAGQLTSVTDALGGVTRYGYDGLGNRVSVTDARGSVTWSYFDKAGRVIATRDAANFVTETSYTAFGEIATVTRRANASYTVGASWPAVHAHAADATTRFAYDKLGRVVTTTDAEGFAEHRQYNAHGDVVRLVNKLGGVTNYDYYARGLLRSEHVDVPAYNADGGVVSAGYYRNLYYYDSRGNVVSRVEGYGLPEQRTTRFAYDKLDRLIETRGDAVQWVDQGVYGVQGATEPVERRRYDARGNLAETIDPRGARTLSWYDALDRKTVEIDAAGTRRAWTYDAVGNVTAARVWGTPVAQPSGIGGTPPAAPGGEVRETLYAYDGLNRLTSTTVANLRTGAWAGSFYVTYVVNVTTRYDYDATGNVLRVVDGAGNAVHSTYDLLGRRIRQVDGEGYVTGWIYDAEGNVLHERRWANRSPGYGVGWISDPGITAQDRVTDFTHDRMGRRLAETRRGVEAYSVDGYGNLIAAPSDATVTYQYNGLGQVTRRVEATGDTIFYEYDVGGRLAHETRAGYHDQDGVWTQPLLTYRYNGLGDLARTEQSRQGGGDVRIVRYGYSAGGRLHTMTDAAGTVFTYWQDIAGGEVAQTWNRNRADGSVQHEGVLYTRDVLGRVTGQSTGWWNGQWNKGDIQETRYNAYGEVSQRGINGLQESFGYDAAGQLAQTNSGDGVWRYFVSDGAGRRTLTMENQGRSDLVNATVDQALAVSTYGGAYYAGDAAVTGLISTIAILDRRGQQVATRLPNRDIAPGDRRTLDLAAGYTAFGELAWERDAMGATTSYAYNTMGRRTVTTRAAVSITDEWGGTYAVTPTERFYYDVGGRMVGQDDANTRRTTRHLLGGTGYGTTPALVTAEFHADGGVARSGYDRFGDKRRATDEVGRTTIMHYDALGRLTHQIRPSGHSDSFAYDVLGQRIRHWNSMLGYWDAETTDYDHQGRIVATRAFGGETSRTEYFREAGITTVGMGTYGGFRQITFRSNGLQQEERSDIFGRVVSSHDHVPGITIFHTDISYDLGGRMVSRSQHGNLGTDETVTYSWYNTGLLAEQSSDLASGYVRAVSRYGYDAAGRRTYESFVRDGVTYTDARASYDALGRMTYWEQGHHALPYASMTWSYDAVGNIRRVKSDRPGLDQHGNVVGRGYEDRWFLYDRMNRVVVDGGRLAGNQIVRGASGASLTYDAAGQRVSSTRDASLTGQVLVYQPYGDGGGPPYYFDQPDMLDHPGGGEWVYRDAYYQGERRERYYYFDDGQLGALGIEETNYYDDGNGNAVATGVVDRDGGTAQFTYDAMGRQVRQVDRLAGGQVAYDHEQVLSASGRVDYSVTRRLENGATLTAETYNDYGAGGVQALGQVVSATTYSYRGGQHQGTTYVSNSYILRNGGAQITSSQTSGQTQSSTYYNYGAGGRLESIAIYDGRPRTVSIVSDLSGQALTRDEVDNNHSVGDPHQRWYRFNGSELGHVGNDGTWAVDYASSVRTRGYVAQNGALGNNRRYGYQFAKSIDTITSYEQGSSGGGYTVRSGDTLAGIAAQVWGDASLWYKLANANGLSATSALTTGQTLTLPAGVTRSTYTADQLRPYDPADAIGDVSPVSTTPAAQARRSNKCGTFGKILLVAVAVAVTLATSGTAAAALAPGAAAAAGGGIAGGLSVIAGGTALSAGTFIGIGIGAGIAGSMVSQGVGLATGIQDKFSWKGVALAGIAGGVGGGLGALAPGGGIAGAALRGAAGNALTQGIAMATGLQGKFDWAGVAVAGVVGGVGQAVGGNSMSFGRQTAASAASAIAGAATLSVLTGTSFGDNILAVLPDVIGTTIGNAFARRVAGGVSGGAGGPSAGDGKAESRPGTGGSVNSGRDVGAADAQPGDIVVTASRRGGPTRVTYMPSVTVEEDDESTDSGAPVFPTTDVGWAANRNDLDRRYATFRSARADAEAKGLVFDYSDPEASFAENYRRIGVAEAAAAGDIARFDRDMMSALTFPVITATTAASVPVGMIYTAVQYGRGEITETGAALGILPGMRRLAGRGLKGVGNAAESATARATRLGLEGEAAAGITGPKSGVIVNGRMRFPDELSPTLLKEVKNVGRQGWTRQLKDYADLARQNKVPFELWVRENTTLTRNLRAARDLGEVIIRPELPKR